MAASLSSTGVDTPAGRAMMEAVELTLEDRSPYPHRAWFLDADMPNLAKWIAEAVDEGKAVVLVWEDGTTRILHPEPRADAAAGE